MAGARQIGRRHHLSGRPPGNAFPGNQQGIGEMRANLVEVVQDRGDCPPFPVPALDEVQKTLAGPPVDRGKGLVEQEQLGILDNQPAKRTRWN
jgi:hypothetical protein